MNCLGRLREFSFVKTRNILSPLPLLLQVWKLDRRIRFFVGFTLIGIVANLGLGVTGTFVVVQKYEAVLMMIVFSCRNTHIALDTIVLYHGLGITRFNIEGSPTGTLEAANHADDRPVINASDSHSGTHASSGGKSSGDETPPLDHTVSPYVC